jgi:hypothetical protein
MSFHIQEAQKFEYPHNSLDVLVCKKGDKFGPLVGLGDKVELKLRQAKLNHTELDQVCVQVEVQG